MKLMVILTTIFFVISLIIGSQPKEKETLRVFASLSLKESLGEIEQIYEKNNNCDVKIDFAASGTLKEYINDGVNCDIFISATSKFIWQLQEKNMVYSQNIEDLLKNELVVVSNKNNKKDFYSHSNNFKLAVGDFKTTSIGYYTKLTLQNLNMYDELKDNLVYSQSVDKVLSCIEDNKADFAIIYKTTDFKSKKYLKVKEISELSHPPIIYSMALVKKSENKEDAKLFMKYLKRPEILSIFTKYGFTTL